MEKNNLEALNQNNQVIIFIANRKEREYFYCRIWVISGILKILCCFCDTWENVSKWRPLAISPSLLHWTQRHQKLSESKVQPGVDWGSGLNFEILPIFRWSNGENSRKNNHIFSLFLVFFSPRDMEEYNRKTTDLITRSDLIVSIENAFVLALIRLLEKSSRKNGSPSEVYWFLTSFSFLTDYSLKFSINQ